MKKRKFEIITNIKMLWVADEKEAERICGGHEDIAGIIKILNKLYGTEIKTIILAIKDVARLGYNIFYKEE